MSGLKIFNPVSLTRSSKGKSQELIASKHLQQQGLRLIKENFNCRFGEIDLIMQDGTDQLVFVEVRYRKSEKFGGALASVTAAKQRKLKLTAACFLQAHRKCQEMACRFDVVAFTGSGTHLSEISWIKNAFS